MGKKERLQKKKMSPRSPSRQQKKKKELKEARAVTTDMTRTKTSREDQAAKAAAEGVSQQQRQETVKRTQPKVGRNDLCPCGSGKKFKHCHGQ